MVSFPFQDYKQVLALVHSNILATDITNHLKDMQKIEAMAEEGFLRSNTSHHELLCSLIMTSCDLCACCKDWQTSQAISVGMVCGRGHCDRLCLFDFFCRI